MLKQRIITGLTLAAIIIFCIYQLPNSWFALIFALATLVGAWEWGSLVGKQRLVSGLIYVVITSLMIAVIWWYAQSDQILKIFFTAALWWGVVVILVALYIPAWLHKEWLSRLLQVSGFVVLVPAWLALVYLHNEAPSMLLFLFVLVSVADIAAYFSGKKFGKNKLAPELSPGKSREGFLGALFASFIVASIGILLFELDKSDWIYFICLCVITVMISVVGDLYESLLKRNAGAKDSGKILPGHGGVLDRIDSITSAAPGFVIGYYWLL